MTGAPGLIGPPRPRGLPGVQGEPGQPGSPGETVTGVKGQKGRHGPCGQPGKRGDYGKGIQDRKYRVALQAILKAKLMSKLMTSNTFCSWLHKTRNTSCSSCIIDPGLLYILKLRMLNKSITYFSSSFNKIIIFYFINFLQQVITSKTLKGAGRDGSFTCIENLDTQTSLKAEIFRRPSPRLN